MANVVFLWHMHQPYYVDPAARVATMPWVRLHAVKGYLDMISVIEDFPGVRVNFNLTPVLLLQIKELTRERFAICWLDWSRTAGGGAGRGDEVRAAREFLQNPLGQPGEAVSALLGAAEQARADLLSRRRAARPALFLDAGIPRSADVVQSRVVRLHRGAAVSRNWRN